MKNSESAECFFSLAFSPEEEEDWSLRGGITFIAFAAAMHNVSIACQNSTKGSTYPSSRRVSALKEK
jgi:hypothetical protein